MEVHPSNVYSYTRVRYLHDFNLCNCKLITLILLTTLSQNYNTEIIFLPFSTMLTHKAADCVTH